MQQLERVKLMFNKSGKAGIIILLRDNDWRLWHSIIQRCLIGCTAEVGGSFGNLEYCRATGGLYGQSIHPKIQFLCIQLTSKICGWRCSELAVCHMIFLSLSFTQHRHVWELWSCELTFFIIKQEVNVSVLSTVQWF